MNNRHQFMIGHWVIPSIIAFLGFIWLRYAQWDEQWASLFYNGTDWPFKDNIWLTQVIHNGGHKAVLTAYVALLIYWIFFRIKGQPLKGVGYILLAMALSSLVVSVCKKVLHFPCPWEALSPSGIFMPYQWRPDLHGCVPSGHASSGYGALCLYYVGYHYFPKWRFGMLIPGLLVGILFGVEQQMRGAHFISHDWLCAYVCWLVASAVYFVGYKPHSR